MIDVDRARRLLDEDEPAPFLVVQKGAPRAPFVIVCDHAGRALPRRLGSLGVSKEDLATHIGWDIGAAAVARHLAVLLEAFLVVQRYSRLVIDCNRPLAARDSIAAQSGGVSIPGNQGLSRADGEERARSVFLPYHAEIRSELDRRARQEEPTVLVSMHSFTPALLGDVRRWHTGVLYNKDARFAHAVLEILRRDPTLVVGDNEPYAGSELTDYSIVEHGERRGLLHVEIEIRQDLIADDKGQILWAERFARVLRTASETFRGAFSR